MDDDDHKIAILMLHAYWHGNERLARVTSHCNLS